MSFSEDPTLLGLESNPSRLFPRVSWDVVRSAYTYGPFDVSSGNSNSDTSVGTFVVPWVGYILNDGSSRMRRFSYDTYTWEEDERFLLTLTSGLKDVSFSFDSNGFAIVAFINASDEIGFWRKDPVTNLNSLTMLGSQGKSIYISSRSTDLEVSDPIMWVFKEDGTLEYRTYTGNFADPVTVPLTTPMDNPVVLWAGYNHKLEYQVDYKDAGDV